MMVSSGCIPMWKNGTSRRYLEESYFNKCFRRKTQKKTEYRSILLPPSTICLTLWGNFVEAKICLSGAFKSIDHMPFSKIRSAKHPICLGATSGCPQFTTTSTTATIKNRYPCDTESFSSEKQQNLSSRMIASLAFRKLCRFVCCSAANRKLRRAGNNGFCVYFTLPQTVWEN